MTIGIIILYFYAPLAKRLSIKYAKLWVAAEILLFVLVGATVDINYALTTGREAIILLGGVLLFRLLGVILSLWGTNLNMKERIFCMISYIPKATVQAAIGGVPLAMGLSCGDVTLTVAVLSILIMAPLGAMGIELTYKHLLEKNI